LLRSYNIEWDHNAIVSIRVALAPGCDHNAIVSILVALATECDHNAIVSILVALATEFADVLDKWNYSVL